MGPHQRARESGDAEPDEQHGHDPAQLEASVSDLAAEVGHAIAQKVTPAISDVQSGSWRFMM